MAPSNKKRIENAYGYYDEANREYVITRPDTPTPWINYIGEGRYGGIVSNTGGGYSFDRDPRNRRVTRYRYNAIPVDQPGRYIYLRDQESGEYWSPTWQPVVGRKLDTYECRHGAGYTRIESSYRGIRASVLYFVPLTDPADPCPCELWVFRVSNQSGKKRKLRTFSYAEFGFADAATDQNNVDWAAHILLSEYSNGIQYVGTKFRSWRSFLASSVPAIGHDSDREEFIGRYRDLANPIVVESGQPRNSVAPRGNNVGSFCHEIELAPGEEKEIVFTLGITDRPELVEKVVGRYRDSASVEAAFGKLKADWNEYLGKLSVETPDPETNAMLNFWNQVQCRTTLYWSRFVSAYETGLGRGMGTRDTGQDTLGTMHAAPEHTRNILTRIWHLQFKDGHTWHQFYPLTGEGGPGLAVEYPHCPQWFCDDHLWLVISVCAYLKETGDFDYLNQRVPYWDEGEDSIWSHMVQAIEFTLAHRGPHGLPRIGFSDWDDTLNIDHGSGKAESVWCGEQFCRAVLDLADLSEQIGKQQEASRFRGLKDEMAAIVNTVAWDGAWYGRAYDDEGKPIGVSSEPRHQINLIPQVWSIMGNVADRKRAEQAMNSMHDQLNTPFGVCTLRPAYDGGEERIGGTTTYPPGAKENGGVFCHTNAWVIVAAAMLGWGDRAFSYYRQIMPFARTDSDHFMVEPYVYCQNIFGKEHPQFGRGRNAWLTGTAAWTLVAGIQYILGMRPTYRGLQIAPVIPADWKGFSAKRVFRGVTYQIRVERSGTGNRVALLVDGKPVEGDVVPLPSSETRTVDVHVRLS